MVIKVSSAFICLTDDHIVVSVGPYTFQRLSHFSVSSLARSAGIASPPHSAFKGNGLDQPESKSINQVVGVACKKLIFSFFIKSSKSLPSLAVSWSASINVAPLISGRYNSKPAMSKEIVVIESSLSFSVIPGSKAILKRKFTKFLWVIGTPFGLPVDPDV